MAAREIATSGRCLPLFCWPFSEPVAFAAEVSLTVISDHYPETVELLEGQVSYLAVSQGSACWTCCLYG